MPIPLQNLLNRWPAAEGAVGCCAPRMHQRKLGTVQKLGLQIYKLFKIVQDP